MTDLKHIAQIVIMIGCVEKARIRLPVQERRNTIVFLMLQIPRSSRWLCLKCVECDCLFNSRLIPAQYFIISTIAAVPLDLIDVHSVTSTG